jgi:hypothetical protein
VYQAGQAVERDERLTAEMAEWDGTVADGLEAGPDAADLRTVEDGVRAVLGF